MEEQHSDGYNELQRPHDHVEASYADC